MTKLNPNSSSFDDLFFGGTDFWVSSGSRSQPFYRFYADSDGSVEVSGISINARNSYTFRRLGSSSSHPFFVSDSGYKLEHTSLVNTVGDGSVAQGIKGNEAVVLSFNSEDIDNLYYFCTSHSGMIGKFGIVNSMPIGIGNDANYLYAYKINASTWSADLRVNRQISEREGNEVLQAKQVTNGEHASGWVGSIVTGSSGDDIIRGLAGFDQLFGKAGDDLIHGGNGRDIIDGGIGSDELHGDFGWNTYKDQNDGSKDLIAIKSDQHLSNFWYGKAGNSPNGEKADFIEGLDATDEIKIIGVATKDLRFKDGVTAKGVSGIGIYAKGALEAVYTGGNLSLDQISQMTSGDASAAAMANQMWSYWGANTAPALLA